MTALELAMPLKDKLRELRKASGMTQQALAVKAGLSVSNVVHIEAGRIPDPRVSTLKALADALGCTMDVLFAEGPEAETPSEPPQRPAKRGRKKQ